MRVAEKEMIVAMELQNQSISDIKHREITQAALS